MKDEIKTLENYIKWWNMLDIKPKNEPEFINLFIEWIKSIDDPRDLTFDGAGSYFGVQISIVKDWAYNYREGFEIAYSKDRISIYDIRHNGFWVPEYIECIKGDRIYELLIEEIKQIINRLILPL